MNQYYNDAWTKKKVKRILKYKDMITQRWLVESVMLLKSDTTLLGTPFEPLFGTLSKVNLGWNFVVSKSYSQTLFLPNLKETLLCLPSFQFTYYSNPVFPKLLKHGIFFSMFNFPPSYHVRNFPSNQSLISIFQQQNTCLNAIPKPNACNGCFQTIDYAKNKNRKFPNLNAISSF